MSISVNALWTCETLVQKIRIVFGYLLDCCFHYSIALYTFIFFFTRSLWLISKCLHFIKVSGIAMARGAFKFTNAVPAL